MKINITKVIFTALICVTYQAYSMEQIIQNIKNILDSDNISVVTSDEQDQKNTDLTITRLHLYYGNILIGSSTYKHQKNKKWIDLSNIEVKRWRSIGIGEQLFYLTMYNIAQQYPNKPNITWMIWAYDKPAETSLDEIPEILFKFYRRVGASIDDYLGSGDINLKNAGYFDEN